MADRDLPHPQPAERSLGGLVGRAALPRCADRRAPERLTPRGAVRGRDETLAGFRASRDLLRSQEFVVRELVVDGDRAAVRAHWRATIGTTRGPLIEGTQLEAFIASFLTVADGRIVDQETFDCYAPPA